jgi:hypothetical protein
MANQTDILIEEYRGYPIWTLGDYDTAYYYTPACGRLNHKRTIAAVKTMIDRREAAKTEKDCVQ